MKAYLFSFMTGNSTKEKKQYVMIYADSAGDAVRFIKENFQYTCESSIKNLTFE